MSTHIGIDLNTNILSWQLTFFWIKTLGDIPLVGMYSYAVIVMCCTFYRYACCRFSTLLPLSMANVSIIVGEGTTGIPTDCRLLLGKGWANLKLKFRQFSILNEIRYTQREKGCHRSVIHLKNFPKLSGCLIWEFSSQFSL